MTKPTLAPQTLPVICNTHYLLTNRGLMDCKVPDFDKLKYKGLNFNTRKQDKLTKKH